MGKGMWRAPSMNERLPRGSHILGNSIVDALVSRFMLLMLALLFPMQIFYTRQQQGRTPVRPPLTFFRPGICLAAA